MIFFAKSDFLEYFVTRPLSHIRANWELTWDSENCCYEPEEDSYAEDLNKLIQEIENAEVPEKYHDNEDSLAEYVQKTLNWGIYKVKNRWICGDYRSIINQGGFGDKEQKNLIAAAAGRIAIAKEHGQSHFDDMEEGHQRILACVLSSILYHRD